MVAVSLRENEKTFIREMNAYINELRRKQECSKKEAKREARTALIRTGVLTVEGKEKDKIVTWE